MKKVLTLCLFAFFLILVACQEIVEEEKNYLDITIDLKERTATSIHNIDVSLSAEETQFVLVADVSSLDKFKLRVNELLIDDADYSIEEGRLTYRFFSTRFVNQNELLPVTYTFDHNGGLYPRSALENLIPFYELEFKAFNNQNSNDFTVFTPKETGLRWNYKMFIKYDEILDLYQIVYTDHKELGLEHINFKDYDFILGTYHQNESVEKDPVLDSLFKSEAIGTYLYFDGDINDYTGGLLNAYFFKPTSDNYKLEIFVDTDTSLPEIVKPNFSFKGWYDGSNYLDTLTLVKAGDHKNVINLFAHFEGASIESLNQYLNSIIPTYTDKNIYLPTSYSSYDISWSSSNPEILSNTGEFNISYNEKKITLTATITGLDNPIIRTFNIDVLFKKELVAVGIASSYIYRNYSTVNDAFFESLDIINTAFLTADNLGNLNGLAVLNNIQTYIFPKSKQFGNWVLFSVAPESQWSSLITSQAMLDTFADNIVTIINTYGFDGVDIDWETPTNSQRTAYTQLMRTVYNKVKANNPNHLVTTAITGGQWQPPQYDLVNSGQYIDYINVMTYGMSNNGGSYQNPLYRSTTFNNPTFQVGRSASSASIDESVPIFNNYGIPNSKLIFGLAFYGIRQTRTFNSSTGTYGSWVNAGSVFYNEILSIVNNPDYSVVYDTKAGVPYIIKNDGREFISYDNPRSIQEKAQYIYDKELAGLMFWEYGTDTTGQLLEAMATGLGK